MDIGDKRIGVAVSDPDEILASPLTTIKSRSETETMRAILDIIRTYEIERIVVGLPYSMNGTIGTQAEKTLAFKEKLSQLTSVEIDTEDERFSTVAANRLMIDAGAKRNKRKSQIDAAAATYILQGYLDSHKSSQQ